MNGNVVMRLRGKSVGRDMVEGEHWGGKPGAGASGSLQKRIVKCRFGTRCDGVAGVEGAFVQ